MDRHRVSTSLTTATRQEQPFSSQESEAITAAWEILVDLQAQIAEGEVTITLAELDVVLDQLFPVWLQTSAA